jgi:hypothetical protein
VADDSGDTTPTYESDGDTASKGKSDGGVTAPTGKSDGGVTAPTGKSDGGDTTSTGESAGGVTSPIRESAGGDTAPTGESAGGDTAPTGESDSGGTTPTRESDSGGRSDSGTDQGGDDLGSEGRTDGSGNNITPFGFTVSPTTVSPGGSVTLNATRCETPTVRVTAPVFGDVTLNGGRSAKATVSRDAKPGAQYDVTFDCKGRRGTAKLVISGGGTRPTTPTVPGGVEAGDGGSLSRLDATQLLAGTALVAGAVGAGVYAARRRSGPQD